MSEEIQKRGLMYYLNNPGKAAKKLLPFIDVDAIMAENKERYKELGVDPEMGKSLMGMALNPVAFGTGLGTSKAIGGAYKAHSRYRARKDILSKSGWNRYKSNSIEKITKDIKKLEEDGDVLDIMAKTSQSTGNKSPGFKKWWSDGHKANKTKIANLHDDLTYMNSKYAKEEYMDSMGKVIKKTPMKIGYTPSDGKMFVREPKGFYSTRTKNIGIRGDRPFKNFFGGTGAHELKHAGQFKGNKIKSLGGWREKAQSFLDETKNLKGNYQGRNKAKLLDSLEDSRLNRVGYFDDISKPEELSARLTQVRTQPKLYDYLMKKGWYKPSYYKQLEEVLLTPERIKRATKDVWGAAPIGLLNYSKD